VIRLGDGTQVSHERIQQALDDLWSYAGEMFVPDDAELALVAEGILPDVRALHSGWDLSVDSALREATLARPTDAFVRKGGKQGVHSEHLGRMLAEMQFLPRAYPEARW
jgi:ring-1,2-phenylacetyl-CoA epoxidase subunit PaaC